eukprot:TRINITY_DN555_c2_g2_i1.p1 TRINITY_DN555_c2_g2~~TRINITY_DN555_c2_g2_i1.p1  ORF type:complete len:287 (+),score=49.18 TRINITY_DN555_c2_g2_i1:89-949(+)
MRVKKKKHHRKMVRFYKACFGFREPFKVLCDGTFVHHLILNHHFTVSDKEKALSNLLGSPTKLFVTRCILEELKTLGDSYSQSLQAARNLFTARCDHEQRKSAAKCIEGIIGANNPEHYFLATQDTDLQKIFQAIPGVPVIYGLRNSLYLEPPSASQRQFVKSTEEERLRMSELEYKMLVKREKRLEIPVISDATDASEEVGDEVMTRQVQSNINGSRRKLGVANTSKFKRKRAKGPNPLSCKKKKNNPSPSPGQNHDGVAGDITKRKRNRRRSGHMDRKLGEVNS